MRMIPAKASRALAEASGGRRFSIGKGELLRAILNLSFNLDDNDDGDGDDDDDDDDVE